MKTQIKDLREITRDGSKFADPWRARAVENDDNMTYVVWNEATQEALVVDPMREDWEGLLILAQNELKACRFMAVIDTHTHADHISCAADLATELKAPLTLLVTPGHTAECITPIWGPFLFGGDTLLCSDTGRDGEGGRVSSWKTQLEISPGLAQDKGMFIKDAGSYIGPSPKLLKESLYENFK